MRLAVLTAAAAAALTLAAPALAHFPANASRPDKLYWVAKAQERNLEHATYFCRHAHLQEVRRWHCAMKPIIRRELRETRHRMIVVPTVSYAKWACIHRHEGAWNANTGNGYYGGLQMNWEFMEAHGAEYLRRWGTADHWPVWAQIAAAEDAYRTRGFGPWPNTARACGLL